MLKSLKYSYLALKLGLVIVFAWLGIDKFIHPSFWLNVWNFPLAINLANYLKVPSDQLVYINGVFEILVAIGLIAGIFPKFFSILAILFLINTFISNGLNEITVANLGLIGGLVAVLFWPARPRFDLVK
jgi:uncharacterized membrane protein YphA (DoxX/SURF4 family)